jgi:hypothetical protein
MTIIAEFKASPEYNGSPALPSKYNKAFAIAEEPKPCRARARRVYVDSGDLPLGALLLKMMVRVGLIIRDTSIGQDCSLPTIPASAGVFDPALVSQRL